MTEIKIEKKKPIWPWIVGLLILAALIYFLFFMNKDSDNVTERDNTTTEQVMEDNNDRMENTADLSNVAEIDAYTKYISDSKMGVDHEYTHGAINKLVAATRATANALNVDVDADLKEANAKADEITKDPTKLNHADKIKTSAENISRALETIQTEKFPQLQSQYTEVETAVSNIDPNTQTLEQKDAVNAFFNKADNLLTSIKNNHGQAQ